MKEQLIPISEANTQKVRFELDLPKYVGRDAVGVNVSRLERLCGLAGISHLAVTGLTGQERSSFTPTLVGQTGAGEAFAGKVGLEKKVPTYSTDSSRRWLYLPQSFNWTDAGITINIDEVTARILGDKKWQKSSRDSEAWADHIDIAVRKGVSELGIKHLVNVDLRNGILFVLNSLNGAAIAFSLMPTLIPPSLPNPHMSDALTVLWEILKSNQFLHAINLTYSIAYMRDKGFNEKFRWSIFAGPELDRALLLKVITFKKGLIKPIKRAE